MTDLMRKSDANGGGTTRRAMRGSRMAARLVTLPLPAVLLCALASCSPLFADPPRFPSVYDRACVEGLIAGIDRGDNALILKFGFFLRKPQAQSLQPAEAVQMVEDAAKAEPTGTRRWFQLESVVGFAAERTDPDGGPAADAYCAIFDNVSDGRGRAALDIAGRSMYELATTVVGLARDLGIQNARQAKLASDVMTESRRPLLKAVGAYLWMLNEGAPTRFPIPWGPALQAAGAGQPAEGLVKDALAPPSFPRGAASWITSAGHPMMAQHYLDVARPLLSNDPSQAQPYFRELVVLLERLGRIRDAAVAQSALVTLSGRGRADLLTLYRRLGDAKNVAALEKALGSADSPGEEVFGVANELLGAFAADTDKHRDLGAQGAALLTGYLHSNRHRSARDDLRATILLAQYYVRANKMAEARRTLGRVSPQPAAGTPARAALDSLRAQIPEAVHQQGDRK